MASQDPEGKRVARQNAEATSIALELISAASRVLPPIAQGVRESLISAAKDLRRIHDAEFGRGGGHLQGRQKLKKRTGHLALETDRQTVTLYLDESGQAHKSQDQTLFVLAGVAMTEAEAAEFVAASNDLKLEYGIPVATALHGPKIEKATESFSFEGRAMEQDRFRRSLTEIIKKTPFQLVASVIRKDELAKRQGAGEEFASLPSGLYEVGLTFIAERFVDMLAANPEGKVCGNLVFESIGSLEDAQHQRAFSDLLIHGTEFVNDGCIRGWLRPGCEFLPKGGSHPLELADLAARGLLTWMKADMPDSGEFWSLWAQKIWIRPDYEHSQFGVKIFPDGDVREKILAFRQHVREVRGEA